MYDYLIVGAGISGLYFANELKKKNIENFIILEQKGRIGGRIKTISINDCIKYDSGALRIASSHKNILKLVEELKLDKYLVDFNPDHKYFINGKTLKSNKNNNLRSLIKKIDKLPKNKRISNTFEGVSYLVSDYKNVQNARIKFGYDLTFEKQNCNDFISKCKNYDNKYFRMSCGLTKICEKLLDNIGHNKLKKLTMLLDFKYDKNCFTITTTNKTYKCKKLILAIPKCNLLKIPALKLNYNILNSVTTNNYMRIFALYPKINGKVWFHNIDKIITDLPIRKIVPINCETGLIQISYSDGDFANIFNNSNINDYIQKMINKYLKIIFPKIKIPNPIYFRAHYWNEGTHFWKSNIDSSKISKLVMQPIYKKPIYICGETYSLNQAWMEGAVTNAKKLLNLIFNKKKQKKEKFFTLKEVSKHNTADDGWVIYNDVVYDVTKFIPYHPGKKAILYGLGKDMTIMFNSVGHSQDARDKMLQYKIGLLKK